MDSYIELKILVFKTVAMILWQSRKKSLKRSGEILENLRPFLAIHLEEQKDANYQTWTPLDLDKRPKIPPKFTLNLNRVVGLTLADAD